MALGSEDGLNVVGQAASIAEANPITRDLEPGVVVLDLSLPDGSGVELCRDLNESIPSTACIIHTGTLRESEMEAATEAGAVAVVLKSLSGTDFLDVIHAAPSAKR
jgi:two-component system response regulator DevR